MLNSKRNIALVSSAILLIAFVVHFLVITAPEKNHTSQLQLARIDFKQPIDSSEAGRICNLINRQKGVENSYFNIKDGILVVAYYLNSGQTGETIYHKVMSFGKYKAVRFVLEKKGGGCPIHNSNSFLYRFYVYYQKVFQ